MRDGWLRTGDLARRLDDGSYRIEGRLSTAFNSGGFLIMPEEVDEALGAAASVRDAKTIGAPDPRFGAITVAFVVTDGPLDAAALDRHCRAQLEDWKVPRLIIGVEQIPRSASGKADISALEKLAEQLHVKKPGTLEAAQGLDEVRLLIEEVFHMDPGSARDDMDPEDIPGWDSYSHTALVLELEERLDAEISAEDAQALTSVGEIPRLCTRLL